jgi:hypothetical protein
VHWWRVASSIVCAIFHSARVWPFCISSSESLPKNTTVIGHDEDQIPSVCEATDLQSVVPTIQDLPETSIREVAELAHSEEGELVKQ